MKKSNSLNKIRKDIAFCDKYWTVLYGSYVNEDWIPERSDIDVSVITQIKDRQENLKIWSKLLEKKSLNYDLRIFELMPLYLQIEITKTYKVLFGDRLEISEYFYQYWKIWKDMINRYESNQFHNLKEKLDFIENRKKILKSV
jgi:predicted nucleotidyltransferase